MKEEQVEKLQGTLVKFNGDIQDLKQACTGLAQSVFEKKRGNSTDKKESRVVTRQNSSSRHHSYANEWMAKENELSHVEVHDKDDSEEECPVMMEVMPDKERSDDDNTYNFDDEENDLRKRTENRSNAELSKQNELYSVFYEQLQNRGLQESQKQQTLQSAGLYGVFFEELRNGKKASVISSNDQIRAAHIPVSEQRNNHQKADPSSAKTAPVLSPLGILLPPNLADKLQQSVASQRSVYNNKEQIDHYTSITNHLAANKLQVAHSEPVHLLSLKASSLFSSSLLFENELLSVYSKSFKSQATDLHCVTIELTFAPKVLGLTLSTQLLDSQPQLLTNPPAINKQSFLQEITQSFTFSLPYLTASPAFPRVQVTLRQIDFQRAFELAVPFSINKFAQTIAITIEDCMQYLECVGLKD